MYEDFKLLNTNIEKSAHGCRTQLHLSYSPKESGVCYVDHILSQQT